MIRTTQHRLACLCAALLFAATPCVPTDAAEARADKPENQKPQPVTLTQVAELTVPKPAADTLPDGQFFASAALFNAWWDKHADAQQTKPDVDFGKQFLWLDVNDANDPNRRHHNPKVADGVLTVLTMSTLIGFEPSDQAEVTFMAVPREGITGVTRWVRETDQEGKTKTVKRVFPLSDQDGRA